ncbi:MAG: prolipoprotein diacylglyceryl transferase [Chloroflexi bacterium]|nr:prolipoprotein diacylglyceryl transferase [Chloroflexota bacterium]
MRITLDPIAFYIGSFSVRWYGIILFFAFLVGLVVLLIEARRLGVARRQAISLYLWSLPFVGVFSKLFFYMDRWDLYESNLALMLDPSGARLDGAIIGYLILLLGYSRFARTSFWLLGDVVTLDIAIAIAVGRWACFFNGCCYGLPCDLPWAVIYTNSHARAPLGVPVHPVQLYQILWYSLIFIVLWMMRRDLKPQGSLFLLFIILHAFGDFVTRIFRDDNEFLFGMQQAQLISILMLAAAIPLYVTRLRDYRRPIASAESK